MPKRGWDNVSEATDVEAEEPSEPDVLPATGGPPTTAVVVCRSPTRSPSPISSRGWSLKPWPTQDAPPSSPLRQLYDMRCGHVGSSSSPLAPKAPVVAFPASSDANVEALQQALDEATEKAARARKAKSLREKKRKTKKKEEAKRTAREKASA